MESVGFFFDLLHHIHIVKYFVFSQATSVMLVVHGGGEEICTCPETTQIIEAHVFLDKHIGVLGYIRVPLASGEITPFTQLRGCIEILRLVVSALVKTVESARIVPQALFWHPPANKQLKYSSLPCVCLSVLKRIKSGRQVYMQFTHERSG